MRNWIAFLCVAGGVMLLPGCGPNEDQIKTAKAISARADRQPGYAESAAYIKDRYLDPDSADYVMWSMEYSSLCMLGGNYDGAQEELLRCYEHIQNRQDTEKEKNAALSNESSKIFKGEPFERAMVADYLGMFFYIDGDYNNARVFFNQADMADATSEENCADFRHDFRLTHYWLGRTYMKLGDEGNARLAFKKAGQLLTRPDQEDETTEIQEFHAEYRDKRAGLEKTCFEQASQGENAVLGVKNMSSAPHKRTLPETLESATGSNPVEKKAADLNEFLTTDFQKDVNLIVVLETGFSPIKILIGENGYGDKILRSGYFERTQNIYLNGHLAGPAYNMLDMFHQADTRGTSEKDQVQLAKGVTQAVLRRLPYVGYAAAFWDVRADHRYWRLLPGEVSIYAAKVKPGVYTLAVQSFDSNGQLLPRQHMTKHFIPVLNQKENIVFLHLKPESDNTYFAPTPK
jgi:tetratricopeptide (TPR) repeat protein